MSGAAHHPFRAAADASEGSINGVTAALQPPDSAAQHDRALRETQLLQHRHLIPELPPLRNFATDYTIQD